MVVVLIRQYNSGASHVKVIYASLQKGYIIQYVLLLCGGVHVMPGALVVHREKNIVKKLSKRAL